MTLLYKPILWDHSIAVDLSFVSIILRPDGICQRKFTKMSNTAHKVFSSNRYKETVSRDILLQFFHEFIFPQAPENNIRVIYNFLTNSSRSTTGINNTVGKFCHLNHWCRLYRWQICHQGQRYLWKIYILILLPKGVKTKQLKLFLLKIFSTCHLCQGHLKSKISWHCPFIGYMVTQCNSIFQWSSQ